MDFARFFQAFIPLFVSIDAVGLVPVFLATTAHMTAMRRRRVSYQAVGIATVVTIGFMFLGEFVFQFLGISDYDFRISGGLVLLVLAVIDLCIPGKLAVSEDEMVGIVPLAMPLIAGPATLTTVLVLRGKHGAALTSLSISANFGILLLTLLLSSRIARFLGAATLRALSKLVMVLLAAIAVYFIRTGIMQAIGK